METSLIDMKQQAYSVSALTKAIKAAVEGNPTLTSIWIKGEISNLTKHSSGHIYFTLKDKDAVISATFFRFANKNLNFDLKDGMSVFAFGGVTLFEKRGSYQFNVASMSLEGMGELQKQIEELKKKLLAEGLFDTARKKPLPFLPRRLGLVTSPTGAALRDIIKVALRRYPNIEILLAPAIVQGVGAAEAIVYAIKELNNEKYGIDVIIAGRGGGSFEDLLAFNEESVVRAFAESRVPIVSAVGHQIDHPLSDDAADLAAPTPSAAAELAIPEKSEIVNEINYHLERATSGLHRNASMMEQRLEAMLKNRIFQEPQVLLHSRVLLMADIESRMTGALKDIVAVKRRAFLTVEDIKLLTEKNIREKKHNFTIALQSLDNLSPLNVMKRGYSIAKNDDNNIIRYVDDTAIGENIKLYVNDGMLSCLITSQQKEVSHGKKTKI